MRTSHILLLGHKGHWGCFVDNNHFFVNISFFCRFVVVCSWTQVLFLVFHLWTNGPVFPCVHFAALRGVGCSTPVSSLSLHRQDCGGTFRFFSLSWTNSEGYLFPSIFFFLQHQMIVMIYTVDIGITMGYMPHFFLLFFVFVLKLLISLWYYIPGTCVLQAGVAGNQRRRSRAWELGQGGKLLTYCALQTLVELAEKSQKSIRISKVCVFLSLMVVLHIR